MMAKWERLFFKVPLANGKSLTISGPSYNGLSMVNVRAGRWSLTHIRSGFRVCHIEGGSKLSYQTATAIADLLNWPDYADAETIRRDNPILLDRVKAILELHYDVVAA